MDKDEKGGMKEDGIWMRMKREPGCRRCYTGKDEKGGDV